jgi:hypothetical protein
MSRYDRLPPGMRPRGLTRGAAAAFAGLSPGAFDKARADGKYPKATLPGGRYDLLKLELSMNYLSNIADENALLNPLDTWRSKRAR